MKNGGFNDKLLLGMSVVVLLAAGGALFVMTKQADFQAEGNTDFIMVAAAAVVALLCGLLSCYRFLYF